MGPCRCVYIPEPVACEYKCAGTIGLEYVTVSVFLYVLVGVFSPVDALSKSELVLALTSINDLSLMYFDLLYPNAFDPFPFYNPFRAFR